MRTAPSGDGSLQLRVSLERLEAARHRAWKARRLGGFGADDKEVEPWSAFLIRWHAVASLEDRLLDAAVRRDLDRVPDRKAVGGHRVMRLVDLPIDWKSQGPGFGGGAEPSRFLCDAGHEVQL